MKRNQKSRVELVRMLPYMDSDKYDNREDESMKHLEGQPMLYPRNDDNLRLLMRKRQEAGPPL
jgi:hypothetical protein